MVSRFTALSSTILLVCFLGMVSLWHRADTRPSAMDETKHMQLALDYRDWLTRGVPLTNEWAHVYPPAYHLTLIPALSLGVPSEIKASLINSAYLLILIAGCVLLTRAQGRPDAEGALAALVAAGYCYSLWTGRRALIDFALMAWVTLSIALLARAGGFSKKPASLLWGLSAGIGMLFKPSFVFFVAGPLAWSYATGRCPSKRKNVIGATGLAALIAAPWYWWNAVHFLDKASGLIRETTGTGGDPRTLTGWLYYLRILPEQLGWGSLAFTALGMVGLLARRKSASGSGLLIAWALSGYMILSAIVNKDPRHTLPLLPALAILSVRGWTGWLSFRRSEWALGVAGLLLMAQNIAAYDRPVREDWRHHDLGRVLAAGHDTTQPFLSAALLAQHSRFFARGIKWSLRQDGIAMKPVDPGDADTGFAEYLIARSGYQDNETRMIQKEWAELKPASRAFHAQYSPCAHFHLPDGSEASIYRRNPHPQFHLANLSAGAFAARLARTLRHWVDGPITVDVQGTPGELREGRPRTVRIASAPAKIHGVLAQRVELTLQRPWFNLYRLWDEDHLGLMGFEAVAPALDISAKDVESKLLTVRGLASPVVRFAQGRVWVSAEFHGIPVEARIGLEQTGGSWPSLTAVLERIRLAHIPLPGRIIGKACRQSVPLYPIPTFPGRIVIHRITAENDHLLVS